MNLRVSIESAPFKFRVILGPFNFMYPLDGNVNSLVEISLREGNGKLFRISSFFFFIYLIFTFGFTLYFYLSLFWADLFLLIIILLAILFKFFHRNLTLCSIKLSNSFPLKAFINFQAFRFFNKL